MWDKSEAIRDWAGDIIDNQEALLKKFKVSIFWIIWYKAHKNDSDLIKFLNQYRLYRNTNNSKNTSKIIKS